METKTISNERARYAVHSAAARFPLFVCDEMTAENGAARQGGSV